MALRGGGSAPRRRCGSGIGGGARLQSARQGSCSVRWRTAALRLGPGQVTVERKTESGVNMSPSSAVTSEHIQNRTKSGAAARRAEAVDSGGGGAAAAWRCGGGCWRRRKAGRREAARDGPHSQRPRLVLAVHTLAPSLGLGQFAVELKTESGVKHEPIFNCRSKHIQN